MSRGDGFVDAIIRMRGISKSFGSLRANDSIDFELYPGETHALVGENGAGKTTLMRILYGQYKADSGTIEVDGKPVTYNVAGAMKLGIGMVHQNFMQIEKMSILENIIMASAPSRFGFIRYKETRGKVQEMLRRFGLDIYALKCEPLQSDLFGDGISLSAGNGRELLQMGVVAPRIRRAFDLKQEVYYLEMNFDALVKSTRKHRIAFEELSKFPEVKRDLALLVDRQVTFAQLRAIALATERKLLKSVSLFDVYEGDKLPEGKKSYALSFVLEDKSQTLTDKAIERVMNNLQAQFERQAGAVVR